ncbi:hypothetical protein VTK56DRAFT_9136 [Thermocarpiscus australiensis]
MITTAPMNFCAGWTRAGWAPLAGGWRISLKHRRCCNPCGPILARLQAYRAFETWHISLFLGWPGEARWARLRLLSAFLHFFPENSSPALTLSDHCCRHVAREYPSRHRSVPFCQFSSEVFHQPLRCPEIQVRDSCPFHPIPLEPLLPRVPTAYLDKHTTPKKKSTLRDVG